MRGSARRTKKSKHLVRHTWNKAETAPAAAVCVSGGGVLASLADRPGTSSPSPCALYPFCPDPRYLVALTIGQHGPSPGPGFGHGSPGELGLGYAVAAAAYWAVLVGTSRVFLGLALACPSGDLWSVVFPLGGHLAGLPRPPRARRRCGRRLPQRHHGEPPPPPIPATTHRRPLATRPSARHPPHFSYPARHPVAVCSTPILSPARRVLPFGRLQGAHTPVSIRPQGCVVKAPFCSVRWASASPAATGSTAGSPSPSSGAPCSRAGPAAAAADSTAEAAAPGAEAGRRSCRCWRPPRLGCCSSSTPRPCHRGYRPQRGGGSKRRGSNGRAGQARAGVPVMLKMSSSDPSLLLFSRPPRTNFGSGTFRSATLYSTDNGPVAARSRNYAEV